MERTVVNGSDAPTSCGITYATNFVNLKNLRNFERTVFSYIGGTFCATLCHPVGNFCATSCIARCDAKRHKSFLRNDKADTRSGAKDSYGMTKTDAKFSLLSLLNLIQLIDYHQYAKVHQS
jgi:hypothetical protein